MKNLRTTNKVFFILVICYVILPTTSCSNSFRHVKSDNLFIAHSHDYPNQLWTNLDATITEVQRDGRASLFSISERKGTQGAGAIGRFFFCCATYLANERGFRYFANSEQVDDHILVVYLENKDEDISSLISDKYGEYVFYEVTGTGFFNKLCGIFLGDVYSNKCQYEEAVTYYTKTIELDPKYAGTYLQRGLAYHYAGHYELAISDYTRAIELAPEHAMTYNNRGWTYLVMDQYDPAITDFNKAIELNPKDERFYYNRGLAYEKRGQYDLAISDYTRAIEINPKHARAYTDRCNTYDRKGLYEQAISDCSKAIEIFPRYAKAHFIRGLTYSKKGQYEKAISDFNKAIELSPKYASAYYNIGCIYSLQNNLSKALKYFELALQNGYDDFSWINKDTDWDNIRSSNEFKMLIDKYNK